MVIASVIYSPPSGFYEQLKVSLDEGFVFVVYMNSCESQLTSLSKYYGNLKLLGNGENRGLGTALYEITTFLSGLDERYFLFFDQDSIFGSSFLLFYREIDLGTIFCEKTLAVHFSSKGSYSGSVVDVPFVINSCTIWSIEKLKAIGGFDASYFVDGVDYEVCARSSIKKLKVVVLFGVASLDHSSGQGDSSFQCMGFITLLRKYPMSRIVNFNVSMFRIFITCLVNLKPKHLYFVVRESLIYNSKQILSRFVL